jgi:coenzyme F420 hydrogenase subunit beta
VNGDLATGALPKSTEADYEFGPTLGIYEGWATDPEVRYHGSSGGVLSALSLYSLEQGGFSGVVHTGMDPSIPWLNANYVSRQRSEVLAHAGSRYSPSAPCAGLRDVRADAGTHVFVGRPCDAAAVSALIRRDPGLPAKVGLVLTFFCAGTPSTRGTLDLLRQLGESETQVKELHYRGSGWPGSFRVVTGDEGRGMTLPYRESWSRLTAYRTLRCNLCPDGLGRVSDIACGDAWQHFKDDGDPGRSLILVRTERGRAILAAAVRAGYVTIGKAEADDVLRAQPNLLDRRRLLFGRMAAFRLLGAPVPTYKGFSLFRSWVRAGPRQQLRSVGGTVRRILKRRWYRRRLQTEVEPEAERS